MQRKPQIFSVSLVHFFECLNGQCKDLTGGGGKRGTEGGKIKVPVWPTTRYVVQNTALPCFYHHFLTTSNEHNFIQHLWGTATFSVLFQFSLLCIDSPATGSTHVQSLKNTLKLKLSVQRHSSFPKVHKTVLHAAQADEDYEHSSSDN